MLGASTVSVAAQAPVRPDAHTAAITTLSAYPPHRVYDTRRNRLTDFEGMVADLAGADIVFLGEQHDDRRTHQLQAAVLEGIARRRAGPVALALEMFERDVQPGLDAYLAGERSEEEFLAAARPWPNYRTDYRPMVEFARTSGWPVVAGNVPRRLASGVARAGLGMLDTLAAEQRAFVADELRCPRDRDDYWKRFKATMGDLRSHGMQLSEEQAEAMVVRMYEAQCVKDETMAEAVVAIHEARGIPVVHANGSFHSDYRLGAAERVKRRLPRATVRVVSFVPVQDLDRVDGKSRRKLGDYVVFTLAPPKADSTATATRAPGDAP
jgi:uncharacterized iron-regulated protein